MVGCVDDALIHPHEINTLFFSDGGGGYFVTVPRKYCQTMRQILTKMGWLDKTSKFHDISKEEEEAVSRIGIPIVLDRSGLEQHSSNDRLKEYLKRELLLRIVDGRSAEEEAEGGDEDENAKLVGILTKDDDRSQNGTTSKKKESAKEEIERRCREVGSKYTAGRQVIVVVGSIEDRCSTSF